MGGGPAALRVDQKFRISKLIMSEFISVDCPDRISLQISGIKKTKATYNQNNEPLRVSANGSKGNIFIWLVKNYLN
jgi:hypothetical protein